jgi:flagellar M-ring protein FliF
MDFLNKAFLQLKDLFRSMSAGARITAALLLVLVVVSLAYLFRYQMSGPGVYLMNGEMFSLEESGPIEAAFGKEGLTGWEWEGNRIRFPRGQQARFMAALAKNDALPRRSGDYIEKALNGTNILMDSQHRKDRVKAGREKEFALRIRLMPNIQDAFVMYDTETKRGISPEIVATASVSVTPKGSQPLSAQEARSIRNLVASGIAGLKPENVRVVDLKHAELNFGDAGSGDPLADVLAGKTQTWQEQFKKDILGRLAHISGALVSVSVQLDTTKSTHKMESKVESAPDDRAHPGERHPRRGRRKHRTDPLCPE